MSSGSPTPAGPRPKRTAAAALLAGVVSAAPVPAAPAGSGADPSLHEVRAAAAPAPVRQQELVRLVRRDCGSCHGLTLAGGLGPALLPAALRGKPVVYLQATILRGRPGTPMPGWQGLLSEQDAHWIAARLSEGFPDAR